MDDIKYTGSELCEPKKAPNYDRTCSQIHELISDIEDKTRGIRVNEEERPVAISGEERTDLQISLDGIKNRLSNLSESINL